MTDETSTTTTAPHQVPALSPKTGALEVRPGRVGAIIPASLDEVWRLANAIHASGMAPKGYGNASAVTVGILHGLEVGLTPLAALQSIAVINGMPTIWGDGALALVRASGEMEDFEETFEGKPYDDDFKAVCAIMRRGAKRPYRVEFSVADAKEANLWGKSGPWQQYRKRMLQMRARAWCIRGSFADVLRGFGIREEVEDTAPALPPPQTIQAAPVATAGEGRVSAADPATTIAARPSVPPPPLKPRPVEADPVVTEPAQSDPTPLPVEVETVDGAGDSPAVEEAEVVDAEVEPDAPKEIDWDRVIAGFTRRLRDISMTADKPDANDRLNEVCNEIEAMWSDMFPPDQDTMSALVAGARGKIRAAAEKG